MKPYQAAIMNAFCLRNICEDIMCENIYVRIYVRILWTTLT